MGQGDTIVVATRNGEDRYTHPYFSMSFEIEKSGRLWVDTGTITAAVYARGSWKSVKRLPPEESTDTPATDEST